MPTALIMRLDFDAVALTLVTVVYSLSMLLRTFALLGYQIYKNEIAYKTLYPTNLHRSTLPCKS